MRVGFLGAGEMAEGILSAMEDPSSAIMAEKRPERAAELAGRYGVATTDDVRVVAREAQLVFLAVRPQDVATVAAALDGALGPAQILASIVAGKTLAYLRGQFGPRVKLVRVMPNLALRAKAGMCAICPDASAGEAAAAAVRRILDGAGETVVLEERHFDAVTALSGSGPAYFAYMQQAMAAAGAKLGLPEPVAGLLAAQTMYGTAKFLRESRKPLADFIAGVCTRGGTTAAGMEELSRPGFGQAVEAALAAAARRSRELA